MTDQLTAALAARMPADYPTVRATLLEAGWQVTVTVEPAATLRELTRENIFIDGYQGPAGQTVRFTYLAQYPQGAPAAGFALGTALAPVADTVVPVEPETALDFVRTHPALAPAGT